MANVKSIERAVESLRPGELAEFRRWFAEFDGAAWYRQIEQDASDGKLDYLIPTQGQVEADIVALKSATKALDKLLEDQGVDVESVVADFKAARGGAITAAKKPKHERQGHRS